jgi:hypothetical protein
MGDFNNHRSLVAAFAYLSSAKVLLNAGDVDRSYLFLIAKLFVLCDQKHMETRLDFYDGGYSALFAQTSTAPTPRADISST